jgi:hypothetical protein
MKLRHFSLRRLVTPVLAGLLFIASGPALAETVHESRQLATPIDTLVVNGDIDVELVQDGTAQVVIDAPAGIAKHIQSTVEHGTLTIDEDSHQILGIFFSRNSHPFITVHLPQLNEIRISGAADLMVGNWSSPADLRLELKGSGDLEISHLVVRKITTVIEGSADVTLSGSASEQDVRIAGSGDYRATDLKSGTGAVAILGSGDVSVWVQDALAVTLKGSGDVEYFGSPTLAQSIKGSGNVTGRGPKG